MKALAVLAMALLAAGCIDVRDERPPAAAECQAELTPADVPASAGAEGGHGPRLIRVSALVGAGQPVLAYWLGEANGTVEFVALRTSEGAPALSVHARAGVPVGVLAGRDAKDGGIEGWRRAATVPAGDGPADIVLDDRLRGEVSGDWDAALATGLPDAMWQPQSLPDLAANLGRVESVAFTLRWTNGAQGGADFGIGLASGGDGSFRYTNAEYQADVGEQQERREVSGDELVGLGWGSGTPAQAGPSVSTGGFTASSIPYTLAWEATLLPVGPEAGQVCGELGPVREVNAT